MKDYENKQIFKQCLAATQSMTKKPHSKKPHSGGDWRTAIGFLHPGVSICFCKMK